MADIIIQVENDEPFYCELHIPPDYVSAIYFDVEEMEIDEDLVLEGIGRNMNADVFAALQADAQANNGRALVSVRAHQHSEQLDIFYCVGDVTIKATFMQDVAESDYNEEEEEISYDHNVESDYNHSDYYVESDYNEEEEQISYDHVDSFVNSNEEMSDKEAAEILGSATERINLCDGKNLCVICQESLEDGCGDIKQLPCNHIYHYDCILRSTKINNACPLCRGVFDCRERQSC